MDCVEGIDDILFSNADFSGDFLDRRLFLVLLEIKFAGADGAVGSIPEGTADADRIVVTQIPPDFTDDHRHGIGGETDV